MDEVFQGTVKLFKGIGQWAVRCLGAPVEQLGQPGAQQAVVQLHEEHGYAAPLGADLIPVAVGQAFDQSMLAQAAQIIGRLVRAVVRGGVAHEFRHLRVQPAVAKVRGG